MLREWQPLQAWHPSWGSVFDSLVNQDGLLNDGLPDWLVDNGLEPTGGVGVLITPRLVQDILEATRNLRSKEEICKSDPFTDEEGVNKQVVFQDLDDIKGGLLSIFDRLLVVRVLADQRAEPKSEMWEDLGV